MLAVSLKERTLALREGLNAGTQALDRCWCERWHAPSVPQITTTWIIPRLPRKIDRGCALTCPTSTW